MLSRGESACVYIITEMHTVLEVPTLAGTITHSILGYLASVYSMFTCLSVDRYYQQEVDVLPSNPSFRLCFAAFFGLFCCRPTSKRENNNGRFSHFHVVLAHHSGHSSLNKWPISRLDTGSFAMKTMFNGRWPNTDVIWAIFLTVAIVGDCGGFFMHVYVFLWCAKCQFGSCTCLSICKWTNLVTSTELQLCKFIQHI